MNVASFVVVFQLEPCWDQFREHLDFPETVDSNRFGFLGDGNQKIGDTKGGFFEFLRVRDLRAALLDYRLGFGLGLGLGFGTSSPPCRCFCLGFRCLGFGPFSNKQIDRYKQAKRI